MAVITKNTRPPNNASDLIVTTVISQRGDTVDAICQRYYGHTAAVTEAVYEANPGLAEKGLTLPAGITITLPAVTPETQESTINLWD